MISKKEVEHIAKLARLKLSEKEVGKMQKDLSEILDYFNLLKKAPKPKAANKGMEARYSGLRKDEAVAKGSKMSERLILAAPAQKEGYIKVKNIF